MLVLDFFLFSVSFEFLMPKASDNFLPWLHDVLHYEGKAGRLEFALILTLQYVPALLFFIIDRLEIKFALNPFIFFGIIIGVCGSIYIYFSTLCRRARSAAIPIDFVLYLLVAMVLVAILNSASAGAMASYLWIASLFYVVGLNIFLLFKKPS